VQRTGPNPYQTKKLNFLIFENSHRFSSFYLPGSIQGCSMLVPELPSILTSINSCGSQIEEVL
jgi:hypothetical protein